MGFPLNLRRLRGINAGLLAGSNVLRLMSTLLATVLLGRSAGASALGVLSSTLAIAAIAQAVSTMGLSGVAVKRLIEDTDQTASLRMILAARLLTVPLAFVVASAIALWIIPGRHALVIIAYFVGFGLSVVDVPDIYHQASGLFKRSATLRLVAVTVAAPAKAISAWQGDLNLVLLSFAAEAILWQGVLWPVVIRRVGATVLRVRPGDFRNAVRQIAVTRGLSISGGLAALSQRADILLVSALAGTVAAGNYSAASRLVEATLIVSTAMNVTNFPNLTKSSGSAPAYAAAVRRATRDSIVVATILIMILITVGPWLITALYGRAFSDAADVIRIYSLTLLPLFLRQHVSKLLVIEGAYWLSLSSHAAALATVIAGNLLLVPVIGIWGAALSSIGGYSVGLAMSILPTRRGRLIGILVLRSVRNAAQAERYALELSKSRKARVA